MQTDGTLLVPDVPTVPYITGDGVGAEVTPAMQAVVDAVRSGRSYPESIRRQTSDRMERSVGGRTCLQRDWFLVAG